MLFLQKKDTVQRPHSSLLLLSCRSKSTSAAHTWLRQSAMTRDRDSNARCCGGRHTIEFRFSSSTERVRGNGLWLIALLLLLLRRRRRRPVRQSPQQIDKGDLLL